MEKSGPRTKLYVRLGKIDEPGIVTYRGEYGNGKELQILCSCKGKTVYKATIESETGKLVKQK